MRRRLHARLPRWWPVPAVALVLVGALLLAAAVRGGGDDGGPGGSTERTVTVSDHVSITLRVPDGAGPHPVVVHVPGGGWTEIDATPVAAAFGHDEAVEAGWALATVRYRTAQDGGRAVAAEQVDDVTDALAWLRTSGAEHGLAATTVGMGHSAGAHLLALATARADTSLQVDSLVLVAGVYDFADDVRRSPLLAEGLRDAVGCRGETCSARARLEPARYADSLDPPVAIVHGTDDEIAPVNGAYRYAIALRAAGVPTSIRLVPGGLHRGGRLDATARAVLANALRQATVDRSNR